MAGIMSVNINVFEPLAGQMLQANRSQTQNQPPEQTAAPVAGDSVSISPEGRQLASAGQQHSTSDQAYEDAQDNTPSSYAEQIRQQAKDETGGGGGASSGTVSLLRPNPEVAVKSYEPMSEQELSARFSQNVDMSGSYLSNRVSDGSGGPMSEDERLAIEQELEVVKEGTGQADGEAGSGYETSDFIEGLVG